MTDSTSQPERDRDATTGRILSATGDILAETGPNGLGVNAIARRAGCDKQLIYRYFGGLDGVLAALGARLADRLIAELDRHCPDRAPDYGAFVAALLKGLLAAYRTDPGLVRIKLAEWDGGATLARLTEARSAALSDWVARRRPSAMPDGDAPALNALLIGAIDAAALSAFAGGRFNGMPLADEGDWSRLARALGTLVASVYPGAEFT